MLSHLQEHGGQQQYGQMCVSRGHCSPNAQLWIESIIQTREAKKNKKGRNKQNRFNLKFGVKPMSAASLYEDMQDTEIDATRLGNPNVRTLR